MVKFTDIYQWRYHVQQKFLIGRGAKVFAKVSANYYRRSPLVQGGLEIPCKLSVELAIATIKNNMLIDRYKQIIQELYEEPAEEVIMGSLLLDDFADFSDMESETNVSNAARPKNRKRKPDEVNEKAGKKSSQETDEPSSSRSDIRKFFKVLPKKKKEEKCNKNSKKSNIIVID